MNEFLTYIYVQRTFAQSKCLSSLALTQLTESEKLIPVLPEELYTPGLSTILLVRVIIRFWIPFGINLHEWVFKKLSCLKNSQVKIKSKLSGKKTVWLLINIINVKKSRGGSAGRLSWSHFFSFEKTFVKVSAQTIRRHFTWYYWLRNSLIVFQPIIIQNYDV